MDELSPLLSTDHDGDVAIVRMHHKKANALDTELCRAVEAELVELAASACRAVIVTGTGSIFSAGVDLLRVLDGGATYLDGFLPALSDMTDAMLRFPKPLVAAVNGHAIAGGCVMVCACDRRLMTDGRGRIGVPELLVGVPFPLVALEAIRWGAAAATLQETIFSGGTHSPAEALRRGLVDEVVTDGQLDERALATAHQLADIPAETFGLVKTMLRQPMFDRIDAVRAQSDRDMMAAWASAAVRAAIERYAEKVLGRAAPVSSQ